MWYKFAFAIGRKVMLNVSNNEVVRSTPFMTDTF